MRGDTRFLANGLRGLFDFGTLSGLSDGELLDRIAACANLNLGLAEAAFEVLVLRHGPMVLRVCRLHLRQSSDINDAFQATFLVFAHRLSSIRRRESVASWLHGVASRVAARARVEAARRGRIEQSSPGATTEEIASKSVSAAEAFDRVELDSSIQEEVRRLPGRYREVIVLCFWEGLTQEEAAIRLKCPLGTVRSRSARARDLLRTRLARRGLAPASAIAAGMLGQDSILALPVLPHLSAALTRSTVRACVAISSGLSTRTVASGSILLLTETILRSVMMIKIKTVLLTSAVIGLGFLAAGRGDQKRDDAEKNPLQPIDRNEARVSKSERISRDDSTPKTKSGKGVLADYVIEAPDVIIVEVLDALPGRPITGERLVQPDGKVSLGFYGEVPIAGLTIPEAKEKVVLHLRKFINDDILGLEVEDMNGKTIAIDPKESDRVYVDVAAWNSKFYYVQGDVVEPGRFHVTGNETILDAINLAGGLTGTADRVEGCLFRTAAKGKPPEKLIVKLADVMTGADPSTDYQLMPGDRLVVYRAAFVDSSNSKQEEPRAGDHGISIIRDLDRRISDLDERMKTLDRKLDRVLERLGSQAQPAVRKQKAGAAPGRNSDFQPKRVQPAPANVPES